MISAEHTALVMPAWWGQPDCAEIERQAAAGLRPRVDYVLLARRLGADVIDGAHMATRAGPVARALARGGGMIAGQLAEVWGRRRHYAHILAWGERRGLPLALLLGLERTRPDLVMVASCPARPRRAALLRDLRAHRPLRAISLESSAQLEIAACELRVPRAKLRLGLPGVDELFWRPAGPPEGSLICSVGAEARDYPTLLAAVRGLGLRLAISAGGIVASAPAGTAPGGPASLPANVTLCPRLSWPELRGLYSRASFVVIPTFDVDYNAGITAICEAMAMGRAVIATASRGQVDYLRGGESGLLVPPGDATALRTAITFLAAHPGVAERMGMAGRRQIEAHHRLDGYVARLEALVRDEETYAERGTSWAAAG